MWVGLPVFMNNRETCDIQFGLSCLFDKSGYIEDSRRAGYKLIWNTAYFEPRHDKTNKMSVRPAKTQISMGNRPVISESSLCAQWAAKDPSFLHADSEDWSDWADAQADLSLRWAHTHFVGFVMSRLICIIIRHHYPPYQMITVIVSTWETMAAVDFYLQYIQIFVSDTVWFSLDGQSAELKTLATLQTRHTVKSYTISPGSATTKICSQPIPPKGRQG